MTKEEYLITYRKYLNIKRFQPNTIETYVTVLKMFLYWCEDVDIFPPNLTKEQLVDYLSKTESASLLRQQIGTIGRFYAWVIFIIKIILIFVSQFSMKKLKIIPHQHIALVPSARLDCLCFGCGYFIYGDLEKIKF